MQNLIKPVVLLCCALILGACSSLKFPGVYRIPVLQGNYLEEDMVEQLEVGLTKRQVRYIMGTPMIQDTFNNDRWDYFYSVRRGDDTLRSNHFTVHFKDDRVTHWDGDYTAIKKQIEQEQEEALEKAEKKEKAKFKSEAS